MARVFFTPQLRRFLDAPPVDAQGETLRGVLMNVFAANPRLRGYILDDQNQLRQHIMVFVDGEQIADRTTMEDRVREDSQVYVMQALSGG